MAAFAGHPARGNRREHCHRLVCFACATPRPEEGRQMTIQSQEPYGSLFNPATIGRVGLKNRVALAPMTLYAGSGPYLTPEEMTLEQIHEVRAAFVTAARLARDAGFDGVEIHGAN